MSNFMLLPRDNDPPKIRIPMMTLREVVMFPRSIVPLFVGREPSIKSIEKSLSSFGKKIFLATQRTSDKETSNPKDIYTVGTVCKILQILRLPDGTIKVLFEGLYRGCWDADAEPDFFEGEYPVVTVSRIEEKDEKTPETTAIIRAINESLNEYAKINKRFPPEALIAIRTLNLPGRVADAVMPHLKIDYMRKQEVLEEADVVERLEKVYSHLQAEIEIFGLERKVKARVKKQMETNQKEYYLNEQIKAINKEMGRDDDLHTEISELEAKLKAKDLSEEARDRCVREIKKLRQTPPTTAEFTVMRNYVDWILGLPWNTLKSTASDLKRARGILEADHYGLDKPKERIIEYLAVQSLVEKIKGPILCFVGPPGVGKTSLARSIAKATDREFVRLSLGGVRDEAEIRGHRRTYVGAMPGKIIQSLRRVSSNNPLFCLDEIDKMSTDFRGDPSSALLEVLDPEQNYAFADHYLDLDYDLSKIFFITTANYLHSIPEPLKDRMEIIKLSGYMETEKQKIAKHFLLPKQLEQNGLKDTDLSVSDGAIRNIIRMYTREAGVRNLERELASICRKTARRIVEEGSREKAVVVKSNNLQNFLGVPKHRYGEKEASAQIGAATGLAWTEMGGELLTVEAALMPGTGKVEITGKLGEVMQESAKAALSYVRSRSDIFGLKPDFHREIDIHIHVPEGATPKDGPSAGITLATALVSALINIPVADDLAMTGEITLRGRVLPIGGLREKLLAAHRGLIKRVLIPADNVKDLKDVPEEILKDITVIAVESMDDVLKNALIYETYDQIYHKPEQSMPISLSLLKEEYRSGYKQVQ